MAASGRGDAAALSAETLRSTYAARDGRGFFNLVFPPDAAGGPLVGWEMRHVVDFFSVTFGLCGLSDQPCDFNASVRAELGRWFREESVTSDWIRATSPRTNCSHSWPINGSGRAAGGGASAADSWPAYKSSAAGRRAHGRDGADPSWPAAARGAPLSPRLAPLAPRVRRIAARHLMASKVDL